MTQLRLAPERGFRGRGRGASGYADAAPFEEAYRVIRSKLLVSLADFKRPKKIYITQTIPRTATGKIQRFKLRELES